MIFYGDSPQKSRSARLFVCKRTHRLARRYQLFAVIAGRFVAACPRLARAFRSLRSNYQSKPHCSLLLAPFSLLLSLAIFPHFHYNKTTEFRYKEGLFPWKFIL